jgi:hypothetical protein
MERARHPVDERGAARDLSGNGGAVSDYLTDLVARTLHLEPMVRPVLPSLFQPGPSASFVETESVRPAPERRESVMEAPASIRQTGERPELRENVEAPVRVVRERHIETSEIRERELASPAPPLPVRETVTRQESLEKRIESSVIERHTRELREITVRTETPPGAPVKREAVAAQSPAAPLSMPAPQARPNPIQRPLAGRRSEEQRDAEQPAVSVTIGRVEVRAVFPTPAAAPPRTKSPAKPVMPLDEYLKGNRREP